MFILRYKEKRVEARMDPIFEHPVFDCAREKMKRFIKQLEKPQETLENPLYTCFKCGSNKIFSIAKQVRSADEALTMWQIPSRNLPVTCLQLGTPTMSITSDVLGCDDNIKWVLFRSLKINHLTYDSET